MDFSVPGQRRRFYDGGTLEEPPHRDEPPRIVLERRLEGEREVFVMLRRIGYADRHLGELLVPEDPGAFTTDLTSVPSVFAWLVPRTGRHLPAALVHDELVDRIDRVEADRVFRDAMADTGTGVVRRWLAWSAVTLTTLLLAPPRRWLRVTAPATLLLVAWLGWCATWDLLDRGGPWAPGVPWIPEDSWPMELLAGAAGAVVLPLVLSLLWGRFAVAGAVLGVGLAALLHVTAAVAALTLVYRLVEELASRRPALAVALGAVLTLLSAATVVRTLLA